MAGTPLRTVRVPTELWEAALECARQRGESLSTVIRRLLTDYVAETARILRTSPDEPGADAARRSAERDRRGAAFLIAQGMIMQRLGLDEDEAARFLEPTSTPAGTRSDGT